MESLLCCFWFQSVLNEYFLFFINGSDVIAVIVNMGKASIDNSPVQLDANGSVLPRRAVQSHLAIHNALIKLDAGRSRKINLAWQILILCLLLWEI